MKYLTEIEFDRLVAVKQATAKTLIVVAKSKLPDDPHECIRLLNESEQMVRVIPEKENCRTMCCGHCNGLSYSREIKMENYLWHQFMVPTPFRCDRCNCEWEPVERFQVFGSQL